MLFIPVGIDSITNEAKYVRRKHIEIQSRFRKMLDTQYIAGFVRRPHDYVHCLSYYYCLKLDYE